MKKKQNKNSFSYTPVLLAVLILGVLASVTCLFVYHGRQTAQLVLPPLVRGVYSSQATDPSKFLNVPGLKDALAQISQDNPCVPSEGRFKQIVLGVTADKTQALIGNSCGSTGVARTFMVKVNGSWQRVGGDWKNADREEFSSLTDIPSCAIVDQYQIEASIAPVCFVKKPGSSSLYAGDITNYTYRPRT